MLAGCSDSTDSGGLQAECSLFSDLVFAGGPGRDGIPALTRPEVVPASEANFRQTDRILGVELNGKARAYPLLVLWWHEIVNDTLGGEPMLVTYCPLTGSGLAFDPRIQGEAGSFGVSGLLFENNLMMFDRSTESLWPQLLLSAGCGPERGTALKRVPLVETTWGEWQAAHPTTTIVTTNTGFQRSYGAYPYGNYDVPTNSALLFPSSPFSAARPPKELVLGVHQGQASVAYPFGVLAKGGPVTAVNDTISGRPILVTFDSSSETARGFDRRANGEVLEFRVSQSDSTRLEDLQTGSLWTAAGTAVEGPLSRTQLLLLEDAYTLFWFAWSVFRPDTRLFE